MSTRVQRRYLGYLGCQSYRYTITYYFPLYKKDMQWTLTINISSFYNVIKQVLRCGSSVYYYDNRMLCPREPRRWRNNYYHAPFVSFFSFYIMFLSLPSFISFYHSKLVMTTRVDFWHRSMCAVDGSTAEKAFAYFCVNVVKERLHSFAIDIDTYQTTQVYWTVLYRIGNLLQWQHAVKLYKDVEKNRTINLFWGPASVVTVAISTTTVHFK